MEIKGEGGAVRQRHGMGMGKGPMGGDNFGVGSLSSVQGSSQNHGSHMPHDGVHLGDHERSNPPGIKMGSGNMHATAHSHHGPHHHHSKH